MLRHYDKVVAAGGTCAMVSLNSVGLAAAKKICDQGALAIHGHRNGWGMLNRHPLLGMEFPAYQKLWRLAGVDQLHVNGIANKFWEPDDSVVRSIGACLAPRPGGRPILPVVSSGQWGGQAPETYAADEDDRPALPRRRRHHGASGRPGGRGARAAPVVGSGGRGTHAGAGGEEVSGAGPVGGEIRKVEMKPVTERPEATRSTRRPLSGLSAASMNSVTQLRRP